MAYTAFKQHLLDLAQALVEADVELGQMCDDLELKFS